MIAKNRKHPVFSPYAAKLSHELIQFFRLHVLQVACKCHHVCLLGIDAVNHTAKQVGILSTVCTHMRVSKMHNPVTVESLWQVGGIIIHMLDFKLVKAQCAAIHHADNEGKAKNKPHKVAPVVARMVVTAMRPT